MSDSHSSIESSIRDACRVADHDLAASLIVERYGGEILAFLSSRLRDEDEAGDAFGEFAEQLWKGLPRFEFRCSARAWAYKIAQRSAGHYRKAQRRRRQVPLTGASRLSRAVERIRTRTLPYLRTEVKDAFQELRERLPEEDRMILVLRVDRRLGWRELADVMLEQEEPSADELAREAARLRKRFQLIKSRLRTMAEEQGLLQSTES